MSDKWRETIELVGILGIVASLIFLALEIRQSRQVGQAEVVAVTIDASNQVRDMIVANSDIWARGCSGEELSASERAVYAQILRAYVINLYWTWAVGGDSIVEINREGASNAYAVNFHRYPGFAAMADAQREWFEKVEVNRVEHSVAFGKAITERLVELREIEPDPDFDPALCGL